ncbi:protein PXR1-like [Thrips palmi]|uniref:Protein PXR1-like n=1 Tax=Thrips palmi TaxID=161013 RepID=A0A6P9A4Y1_THRPL|nr:protein PXR1-like [Thrips palmi]
MDQSLLNPGDKSSANDDSPRSVAAVVQSFLNPVPEIEDSSGPSTSKRITTTRMITSQEFVDQMQEREEKKREEEELKAQRKREREEKKVEKSRLSEEKKRQAAEKRRLAEEKKRLALEQKENQKGKQVKRRNTRKRNKQIVEDNNLSDVDDPNSEMDKENVDPRADINGGRQSTTASQEEEEDALCGKCARSFLHDFRGEKWIRCSNCEIWYHNKCLGLRDSFFSLTFICPDCK